MLPFFNHDTSNPVILTHSPHLLAHPAPAHGKASEVGDDRGLAQPAPAVQAGTRRRGSEAEESADSAAVHGHGRRFLEAHEAGRPVPEGYCQINHKVFPAAKDIVVI